MFTVSTAGSVVPFATPVILPYTANSLFGGHAMTVGPDGNMWLLVEVPVGGNVATKFLQVTPSGVVTTFTTGDSTTDLDGARGILVGSDDNLWGLTPSYLYKCTTGGTITRVWTLPTGYSPSSMALGSDGNIWVTNKSFGFTTATINRVTPSGTVTSYTWATGLNSSGYSAVPPLIQGPDGELWGNLITNYVVYGATVMQRFNISTDVVTQFAIPPYVPANPDGPGLFSGCIGSDDNMYFLGGPYAPASGVPFLRQFQRSDAMGVRMSQAGSASNNPLSVRNPSAGNAYT